MLILLYFSKFYIILCNSVIKYKFYFKMEFSGIPCKILSCSKCGGSTIAYDFSFIAISILIRDIALEVEGPCCITLGVEGP